LDRVYQVIYSNVDLLAGYTKDEMLLFTLFSQLIFYFVTGLLIPNVREFIRGVNKGSLDMVLTKPYPALFYTLTRTLNVVSLLRDSIMPLVFLVLVINWSNIHTTVIAGLVSLAILFLGSLTIYFIIFISALPTIRIGEGEALFNVVFNLSLDTLNSVPYEGFNDIYTLKTFFTFVIPILLANGVSVSVFLNKTDWLPALTWSVISFILVSLITVYLWRLSLRSYSSASS
jgi:ABC-2 type transport system permease protein